MSAVVTLPRRRSIDPRAVWFFLAAAVLGAAVALSASTFIGNEPARPMGPAATAVQPAAASLPEATGTVASLRPFSDAGFAVVAAEGAPAMYRPGVIYQYPGGAVQAGPSAAGAEAIQGRYAPGTIYTYPSGTVEIGAKAQLGTNENAAPIGNCHQCR